MDLHFYFFILIFPPSPGATDGRGQRLFRVSASQPSGVWSVVPMSTYIVVDGSAVPSSSEEVVILMAGQEREIR